MATLSEACTGDTVEFDGSSCDEDDLLNTLPTCCLLNILKKVDAETKRSVLPRVCSTWHALAPNYNEDLVVEFDNAWPARLSDMLAASLLNSGLRSFAVVRRTYREGAVYDPETGRYFRPGQDHMNFRVFHRLMDLKLGPMLPPPVAGSEALLQPLARFRSLRTLRLAGALFTESLPSSLSSLTALTELNLDHLQLRCLPEAVGSWGKLRTLSAAGNQLIALPDAFGNLTSLRALDLSGNALEHVPPQLRYLTNLTCLKLERIGLTPLTGLQDSDVVQHMGQLRELFLCGNNLSYLPGCVSALTQLETLDLMDTNLLEVPEWIGCLTGLKKLCVNRNCLSELPDGITCLTALESLNLAYNALQLIPELDGMPNLTDVQLLEGPQLDIGH